MEENQDNYTRQEEENEVQLDDVQGYTEQTNREER